MALVPLSLNELPLPPPCIFISPLVGNPPITPATASNVAAAVPPLVPPMPPVAVNVPVITCPLASADAAVTDELKVFTPAKVCVFAR